MAQQAVNTLDNRSFKGKNISVLVSLKSIIIDHFQVEHYSFSSHTCPLNCKYKKILYKQFMFHSTCIKYFLVIVVIIAIYYNLKMNSILVLKESCSTSCWNGRCRLFCLWRKRTLVSCSHFYMAKLLLQLENPIGINMDFLYKYCMIFVGQCRVACHGTL